MRYRRVECVGGVLRFWFGIHFVNDPPNRPPQRCESMDLPAPAEGLTAGNERSLARQAARQLATQLHREHGYEFQLTI